MLIEKEKTLRKQFEEESKVWVEKEKTKQAAFQLATEGIKHGTLKMDQLAVLVRHTNMLELESGGELRKITHKE